MALMVAIILILFYVIGSYAFHEQSLIGSLPFVAALVLVIDLVAARLFKKKPRTPEN